MGGHVWQAPTEEPQKEQPVEATGSSIRVTPQRMVLQPATLDAKVSLAGIAVCLPHTLQKGMTRPAWHPGSEDRAAGAWQGWLLTFSASGRCLQRGCQLLSAI